MRLVRLFFWAFVLPPLWAGGPACAQGQSGWQPATAANQAPQALVPRATPVQVAPLAAPGGWAAAPAANRPAELASPALRSAPLTETQTAPATGKPAELASPALRSAPLTETPATAPATPAELASPALRSAPLAESAAPAPVVAPVVPVARAPMAKTYGPQTLNFPEGVTAQFDVIYQTLQGFRPLTLDLYQPRPRDYPLPLLVFVHGGGDTRHAAGFEDFPAILAGLAARGYVIASVNYRLSGEARFPAALQDVKTAIRWLRGRAGEYRIDTTRVAVWGASGGAHLAALAGVACGVPLFAPAGDATHAPSDCVQAVIDWYGVTDLKAMAGPASKGTGFSAPPNESGILGCDPARCPPGLARIASPQTYVSVTSPPFLILHGAADTKVPVEQSQKFHAALRAKNVPAELVIYPGVGHDFVRDGTPDAGINRQALEKVAAFLAATFPPGPISQKVAGPRGRGPLY